MGTVVRPLPPFRLAGLIAGVVTASLGGCTVGPDPKPAQPEAPASWNAWHRDAPSQGAPIDVSTPLQPTWWNAFHDPVLDQLEAQAFAASPDLQKAALHVAQARAQRSTVAAQALPSVNASASENRQRISEYGSSTRIATALGPQGQQVVDLLSQPFNDYQAGLDASWELDFWGRVRRSIQAADADVAQQDAMLDGARLSLASEVARRYVELRTSQRQLQLTRDDIDAMTQRLGLIDAKVSAGVFDHVSLEQQRAELSGLQAKLPDLEASIASGENQLTLLLGESPGALHQVLRPVADAAPVIPPDLAMGLPSEAAARRPDIRAADQHLRSATATIGIAKADLYPHVTLGARFGYESYLSGELSNWASRSWSVGPSISLPLFDRGRRKSVVQLRELQQQEAAVDYHRTVLQAWQEIDDAVTGYTANRQQAQALDERVKSAAEAYHLIQVKNDAGTVDFLAVLDAHRTWLQARRDLVNSEGQLALRYVMVNKAIGNGPTDQDAMALATSASGAAR